LRAGTFTISNPVLAWGSIGDGDHQPSRRFAILGTPAIIRRPSSSLMSTAVETIGIRRSWRSR